MKRPTLRHITRRVDQLIAELLDGRLATGTVLPWSTGKVIKLMDSVARGYPIGNMVVWKRGEQPDVLVIGGGRLSALAGCLVGPVPGDNRPAEAWNLSWPLDTEDPAVVESPGAGAPGLYFPLRSTYSTMDFLAAIRPFEDDPAHADAVLRAHELTSTIIRVEVPVTEVWGNAEQVEQIARRLGN